MTRIDELLRKAELHDQAAVLLREEVARHEAEAKELREQAGKEKPDDEN